MKNHRSKVSISHSGIYYNKKKVLNINNNVGYLIDNGVESIIILDTNGNIGIENEKFNNHGFDNVGNGNLGFNNVDHYNKGDENIRDFNIGNHNRGSQRVNTQGGIYPTT